MTVFLLRLTVVLEVSCTLSLSILLTLNMISLSFPMADGSSDPVFFADQEDNLDDICAQDTEDLLFEEPVSPANSLYEGTDSN